MTREELQVAIDERIPFAINMANGEKYEVSNRYEIALGKRAVVVIDKKGLPHFVPNAHDDRDHFPERPHVSGFIATSRVTSAIRPLAPAPAKN
jgi:hypothetical protein